MAYPIVTTAGGNIKTAAECGYEAFDHFTLAQSAWLDEYYTPLRLQIFGCDSPAGCIPGDLNLDGRVNLEDFAIFANNFQG